MEVEEEEEEEEDGDDDDVYTQIVVGEPPKVIYPESPKIQLRISCNQE